MDSIGSKIRLISKFNVRYEGVLKSIDAENSTITVENVSCYGTENRAPPEQQIPATNDIFQFITFRGDDIKELVVLAEDPAILAYQKAPVQPKQEVVEDKSTKPEKQHESRSARGGNARNNNARNNKPAHESVDNTPVITPATDFDFQDSNQKFSQIMEDMKKLPLDDKEKPVAKYDKKSSFFDSISTAKSIREDVHHNSHDARDQSRQQNIDTFGEAFYRGRGRGRGNFQNNEHRGGHHGGGSHHHKRGGFQNNSNASDERQHFHQISDSHHHHNAAGGNNEFHKRGRGRGNNRGAPYRGRGNHHSHANNE